MKDYTNIPKDAEAAVWFEQEVNSQNEEMLLEEWMKLISEFNGDEESAWFAFSDSDNKKIQEFRHAISWKISEYISQNNLKKLGTDVAVPDEKFEELYYFSKGEVEKENLPYVVYGHFGNSHIHLNILPKEEKDYKKDKDYEKEKVSAVTYQEVRVPVSYLVGVEGAGLSQTLAVLDGGRIGIAALSVGLAQAAFEEATRYAKERYTFNKPIAEHQAIAWMLAEAATHIQTARLMVYYAAWRKSHGLPFTREAAMAKMYASEMAEKVCRDAIQIHGGYGYSQEYPVERMYRDARLMTIGEGTSEIQRMVISREILR